MAAVVPDRGIFSLGLPSYLCDLLIKFFNPATLQELNLLFTHVSHCLYKLSAVIVENVVYQRSTLMNKEP
jgi:hypothetical protein